MPNPDEGVYLYRIGGGDPFTYGDLAAWTSWIVRRGNAMSCIEGPAAPLGREGSEATVARIVAANPDVVAVVLPTVDEARTSTLTGTHWDPARVLASARTIAEAGAAIEVVFPANPATVSGLAAVVLAADHALGAEVDIVVRRSPIGVHGGGAEDASWAEVGPLSEALASLPATLPRGATLHMDGLSGFPPCVLSHAARRPDMVNPRQGAVFASPLGETCDACAWQRQCGWVARGPAPPSERVAPLTPDEALELQSQSGAAGATHVPGSFRTGRAELGLPDLLCLAPWTTLSTTDPTHHPVPCAFSWVETGMSPAEVSHEMGITTAEALEIENRPRTWTGEWYSMENPNLTLQELWNNPLLRRMRREMHDGGASSRCRSMCRVRMGVEERGVAFFAWDDAELMPEAAANRRLLLDEINDRRNVLTAKPLELFLGVSAHCNISCGFCDGPMGAFGDLTDRRRDEVLSFIPSLLSLGVSGPGEPLMNKNYRAILTHLADRGAPWPGVTLTTNGTLLTPSFLRRHADVGWSHVRISLNAGSAATHERMTGKKLFDRIIENLDALCTLRDSRPNRFNVTLSFVLSENQMGDLHRFAEIATKYDTGVVVEPMYGNMRELSPWVKPERLAVLLEELKGVADAFELRNPPLSRAFRAVESFARRRLAGSDFRPLEHF